LALRQNRDDCSQKRLCEANILGLKVKLARRSMSRQVLQSRICGQTLGVDATLVAFYDRVSHFRVANDFGEQQLTHPVYTGPDVRPM